MAITDDIRKTLSDPTPLYFVAGTADLAVQQAKKVPALLDKIEAEAPAKFDAGLEAVRTTDPREVQAKATARAKEAQANLQAKITEVLSTLDADLKKIGESAQDLALRGVGVAAEYVVKARETYENVAEHGEQAVKTWRGEAADEIEELAAVVEPKDAEKAQTAEAGDKGEKTEVVKGEVVAEDEPKATTAAADEASAKKAPAKKAATAKKATPPAK